MVRRRGRRLVARRVVATGCIAVVALAGGVVMRSLWLGGEDGVDRSDRVAVVPDGQPNGLLDERPDGMPEVVDASVAVGPGAGRAWSLDIDVVSRVSDGVGDEQLEMSDVGSGRVLDVALVTAALASSDDGGDRDHDRDGGGHGRVVRITFVEDDAALSAAFAEMFRPMPVIRVGKELTIPGLEVALRASEAGPKVFDGQG